MLRSLVRRSSKKTNFSCLQLRNRYSTKGTGNDDSSEVKSWSVEPVHPLKRILHCIKRDGAEMKRNVMYWKDDKNKAMQQRQVIDWDDPSAPIFPNHVDIVIIGGGVIGSAIAYFCQKLMTKQTRIVVVEKDPTYMQASTVLSVGGLRQQFSLEENIEMSLFGAEFIRNANDYLGIPGEPAVDLQFHPYGYLSLATAETAEILQNNSTLQNAKGAKNVLLTATQLKNKFPWLNVDGIELGCLGLEKEGWFDPWALLIALKCKAISLGVEYVKAEVKGFNFESQPSVLAVGVKSGEFEALNYLVVQTDDGKLRPITFSKCIVAAGAFSAQIAKMAKIGYGKDILSVPLPVEPRKRYVYCFHAPDGPGLNTPMTIDPTGTYFRREGLANYYICGRCPPEDEEPSIDNLEVDSEFFNTNIWPILAQRVKAFESLKVKSSWAGYYEYNTFDENGIVGYHPYYPNLIFATGFSGHGIQHAPAVGQAIAELIRYHNYQTVDLTRLSFDRFITLQPMKEVNIW